MITFYFLCYIQHPKLIWIQGCIEQNGTNIKTMSEKNYNVLPIVPYKLYIVPLVALFDAVYTDGVPICCITGVTSGETRHNTVRLDNVYVELTTEMGAEEFGVLHSCD